MRSVLIVLTVLIAALSLAAIRAGAEEEPRWALAEIQDTSYKPEKAARYEKDPRLLRVKRGTSRKEIIRLLLANPNKRAWFVDENGIRHRYSLVDRQWEREQTRWHKVEVQEHLVLPPPEGYRVSVASAGNVRRSTENLEFDARKRAAQELFIGKGGRCHVNIYFLEQPGLKKQLLHKMLGTHALGDARVAKRWGSTIVEGDTWGGKGYSAIWLSGKDKVVYIFTDDGASRACPKAVVRAYLEKYPSSLPEDLRFDRYEWARRELEYRLEGLRNKIEAPNKRLLFNPPPTFRGEMSRLGYYFEVGPWWGEYRKRAEDIFGEHVFRDGKGDYETYKKELFKLRRELVIPRVEEMVEKAKIGIRFTSERRPGQEARPRFIVGERDPMQEISDAAGGRGWWLIAGVVVAAVVAINLAVYLLYRRRRRRA